MLAQDHKVSGVSEKLKKKRANVKKVSSSHKTKEPGFMGRCGETWHLCGGQKEDESTGCDGASTIYLILSF
jgi:hypothetical protein